MSSALDHAASESGDRLKLVGLMATGFGAMLNLYAPQPVLPLLSDGFAIGPAYAAATVTATALAVALFGPVAGAVSDALGRKPVIVWALVLLALPTLASAWAPDIDTLIALRFLQGMFMPAAFTAALAYASEEWPPEKRGMATTCYVAANIVGGFCGRMIGGGAAESGHWPTAFLALGAVNLACAALALMCLSSGEGSGARGGGGIVRRLAAMPGLLAQPRLVSAFAVGFGVLFCLVTVFTYITFHLSAPPWSLSTAQLGYLFVTYLLGVALMPVSGRITDRFGPRVTVLLALCIGMAGVALTLASTLWILVPGLAALCFSAFVCQAATTRFVAMNASGARSTAAGLYLSFYYAGGAAGAALPGLIWSRAGWAGCVMLTLAVQAAILATVLFGWRRNASTDPAS